MAFELPELPYAENALEPYISKSTIEFHYGKHHRAYVDNLNKLIAGTEFEHKTLEQIVEETAGKSEYSAVFNNAAQAWNHAFFWNCMMPAGGGEPAGKLKEKIVCDFGSYDKFCEDFLNAAVSQFGSGWAWLVEDKAGRLSVMKTGNADNPLAYGLKALMTVDVWEHAYYLDYQNRRADFVKTFITNLIKWPG